VTAIIEVRDLRKHFGTFEAVKGISFSIERGQTFGFLGPNGAGKSTTIKMLTTLLVPTSGTMQIDGNDPTKDAPAVRRSLGIVFQDPSLDDDLSARENMEMHGALYGVPRRECRRRIGELLAFVDLADRGNDYVKAFSGGMKRRLEIARGLLHRPSIIFLDEPTLGLDPQTRNLMWEYLAKLKRDKGITIFFTTHYMDEADRNADTIAIIDHGSIIATGTPEELKRRTQKRSLEDAFLELTGRDIREESASAVDRMRMIGRAHRRQG
jgi:ABC-2 type transport system ATP-binding protein